MLGKHSHSYSFRTDTSIRLYRSQSVTTDYSEKLEENIKFGKWTVEEHTKFIFGVAKHGNDWTEIQKMIKSRTCAQLRSHAQKFFVKIKHMKVYEIFKEVLKNAKTMKQFCQQRENRKQSSCLILNLVMFHEKKKENSYNSHIEKILNESELLHQEYNIENSHTKFSTNYPQLTQFSYLCSLSKFEFNDALLLDEFNKFRESKSI
jgi:SHAQKYF class myb-like DNA-binding protein